MKESKNLIKFIYISNSGYCYTTSIHQQSNNYIRGEINKARVTEQFPKHDALQQKLSKLKKN